MLDMDVFTLEKGLPFDPDILLGRVRSYAETAYAFFRFATTDAFQADHLREGADADSEGCAVSISGGSMQLMETPLINTVPGTGIPGASVAPLTWFFAAGVMTGAVLFGTLATPTVLLDGASPCPVYITGTSSIPGWGGTGALRNQSAAGLLEGVRSRSQLSWGQIANTLGVSRRTVHNWLLGAAIAPGNLQRLLDFSALVGRMDRGDPGDVRIAH